MLLFYKREGSEHWRSLDQLCAWDEFEPIKEQIKDLTPRHMRGVSFRPGSTEGEERRQMRLAFSIVGVAVASIATVLAGKSAAIECDTRPANAVPTVFRTNDANLYVGEFQSARQFPAHPGTLVYRYGNGFTAEQVASVGSKLAVYVPGTLIKDTYPYNKRGEARDALERAWFTVWSPPQSLLFRLLQWKEQWALAGEDREDHTDVDFQSPLGTVFFDMATGNGRAWCGPGEELLSEYLAGAEGQHTNIQNEEELVRLLEHLPVDTVRVPEEDSSFALILQEDAHRCVIRVVEEGLLGTSFADSSVDECWEKVQEAKGVYVLENKGGAYLRGEGCADLQELLARKLNGSLSWDSEKLRYAPVPLRPAFQPPTRWMVQRKLSNAGASWTTLRSTTNQELSFMASITLPALTKAPPEAMSFHRHLLEAVKKKATRKAELVPSQDTYVMGLFLFSPPHPDMAILTKTTSVSDILGEAIRALSSYGKSSGPVFGEDRKVIAQTPARGLGLLSLESLEKMVWYLGGEERLPLDYEDMREVTKKVECCLALHALSERRRPRGVFFPWLERREDVEYWQQRLKEYLQRDYIRSADAEAAFNDLPETVRFASNPTLGLLYQQISTHYPSNPAQGLMVARAGHFLLHGGIDGKYLELPPLLDALSDSTETSFYKRLRNRIIGEAIRGTRPVGPLEDELNAWLGGSHYRTYCCTLGGVAVETLGNSYVNSTPFQQALDNTTRGARRIRRARELLGATDVTELPHWPPLARPNQEQTMFMSTLIVELFHGKDRKAVNASLKLHPGIPPDLVVRVLMHKPEIMDATVLHSILRTLGHEVASESDAHTYVRSLGHGVKSRDASAQPSLAEALLLGNLNVGALGIPDVDEE